jgi:hypothetical protein
MEHDILISSNFIAIVIRGGIGGKAAMDHEMSPDAVKVLDAVLDAINGKLDAIDIANIGHAVLTLGLSILPEHRREAVIAGLAISIPRSLGLFLTRAETPRLLH